MNSRKLHKQLCRIETRHRSLLLFLLLICSATSPSQAREIAVYAGMSIQETLTSAAAGDTINVSPGEYHENILIDKPVYLRGLESPLIRGGFKGHTILVKAAGTIIAGLTVGECGMRLIDDMACIRIEADAVEVRNCRIVKPLHGIYVKGGSYSHIHNNIIEGRLDLIEADRGNGIHLWNSRHNRVHDNEIYDVRDGIYFSFADSTDVWDNHIHHVRYGLHYMYSNHNTFSDNVFEKSVAGAALMYSQGIEFHRNVFARCRGFRAYGILYQSMDGTVAFDNLILDNSRGLFFSNSDHNLLRGNDIVDNDLAAQINGSCEGNTLSGNNFIGNIHNIAVDHERSHITWTLEGRGNYWSNYDGYDLDRDGCGDIPHQVQNVFEIIEVKIPEIRFYLLSPAATILERAEKAMPILNLGTEKDPFPVYNAISNYDVPWDVAAERGSEPDLLLAGVFFFGSGISTLLLHLIARIAKRR